MTSPAAYSLDNQIARIVMDDGKLNVMSLAMLETLHGLFDRALAEASVVILSSGREGIFSAGFDLKVFAANDPLRSHAMVKSGAELALKILSLPIPVIGACRGHAYPMGAFLLLASDIRIGVDTEFRIGLNEVAIGIPAPSFALELARQRIAPAWLNRTAVTGELFGPRDALAAGFIDRLVPSVALDSTATAIAQSLLKIHGPSHALTKRRLRANAIAAIRAAIDSELTLEAYRQSALARNDVRLPGAA